MSDDRTALERELAEAEADLARAESALHRDDYDDQQNRAQLHERALEAERRIDALRARLAAVVA